MSQTIADNLSVLKALNELKQKTLSAERYYSHSQCHDLNMIPVYYERFKEIARENNRDNTKIFIFIMFFMYSPYSCVKRGERGHTRRTIARMLKISDANVSIQFCDAKVLFEKHKGFRAETERIYQLMQDAGK